MMHPCPDSEYASLLHEFEYFIINIEKRIDAGGAFVLHVDAVPWEVMNWHELAKQFIEEFE